MPPSNTVGQAPTQGRMFGLSGRQRLFDPQVLKQYLAGKVGTHVPGEGEKVQKIKGWVEGLASAGTVKESALEQAFNRDGSDPSPV